MKLLDCPFPELLGRQETEIVWCILTQDEDEQDNRGEWVAAYPSCDEATAVMARIEGYHGLDLKVESVRVPDLLAECVEHGASGVILCDSQGNELRRWDLRGHRGEGS